ncbi:hypothetical protein HK101_011981 [Irineochytrium annulatum]|nr:hypothetical protein HK101_011981 [Irineochytrium annulatum]
MSFFVDNSPDFIAHVEQAYDCPGFVGTGLQFHISSYCALLVDTAPQCNPTATAQMPLKQLCAPDAMNFVTSLNGLFANATSCNQNPAAGVMAARAAFVAPFVRLQANLANSQQVVPACFDGIGTDATSCGFTTNAAAVTFCTANPTTPCCVNVPNFKAAVPPSASAAAAPTSSASGVNVISSSPSPSPPHQPASTPGVNGASAKAADAAGSTTTTSSSSSSKFPVVIVGGSVGGLVLLIGLTVGGYMLYRRSAKRRLMEDKRRIRGANGTGTAPWSSGGGGGGGGNGGDAMMPAMSPPLGGGAGGGVNGGYGRLEDAEYSAGGMSNNPPMLGYGIGNGGNYLGGGGSDGSGSGLGLGAELEGIIGAQVAAGVNVEVLGQGNGEKMEVVYNYCRFDDGWGYGLNLTTNLEGSFPMACLAGVVDDGGRGRPSSQLRLEKRKSSIYGPPLDVQRYTGGSVGAGGSGGGGGGKYPNSLYTDTQYGRDSRYPDSEATGLSEYQALQQSRRG